MSRTLITLGVGGALVGGLMWARSAKAAAPAGKPQVTGEPPLPGTGSGGASPGPQTPGSPAPANDNPGIAPPLSPPVVQPLAWEGALPLPTAKEVSGDLVANWGTTPSDLRPLFLLMEQVSGIKGSARIFAVIATRESAFVTTAQNGDDATESGERDASRRAYTNNRYRNPTLKHGDAAAEFGSGGLFGALAPYFLWTGVPEVGDKAPLLGSDPRIMFLPRVAAFGAVVYLQRLLGNYTIADHPDIKVGWANPSLLKDPPKGYRGGTTYHAVRERFTGDAKKLGVDLADTATIPAKLSAAAWPGVHKAFAGLVGTLPVPRAG